MTRGYTLIELTVALLIMAMAATISVVAVWRSNASPVDETARSLREARVRAIESRIPVVWHQGPAHVRFMPDGSATGDSVRVGATAIVVERLTGAARVVR